MMFRRIDKPGSSPIRRAGSDEALYLSGPVLPLFASQTVAVAELPRHVATASWRVSGCTSTSKSLLMLLARIPACRFLVGLSTLVGAGCQQDRPAASSPIALFVLPVIAPPKSRFLGHYPGADAAARGGALSHVALFSDAALTGSNGCMRGTGSCISQALGFPEPKRKCGHSIGLEKLPFA